MVFAQSPATSSTGEGGPLAWMSLKVTLSHNHRTAKGHKPLPATACVIL